MISSRYLPALSVLLVLPLVPTFIHSYAGATESDTRVVASALGSVAGYRTMPTSRGPDWAKENFETDDWLERRYVSDADDVVVTVVRSYNLKTLYHHPELACAYGTAFDRYEVTRFVQRPDVPVHVLQASIGRHATAYYVLNYGERFIEHPIRFQLETAGQLLFSPRRPMSLFFAHDAVTAANLTDSANVEAVSLLFEAIDRYSASRPD
jgi:hypothetical protein